MWIKVIRNNFTTGYTEGQMYLNDTLFCDTLEDTVRILNEYEDKVYGETAIPMGIYLVELTYSPSFKRILPEVLNVDFFKNIRIHNGSYPTDSYGCILVGEKYKDGMLTNSKNTINKLMKILSNLDSNEDIFLCIY